MVAQTYFPLLYRSLLIIVSSVWLSACTEPLQKITISLGDFKSTQGALVLLNEDLGLFKQHGIDLQIHHYLSGKQALNSLLRGEEELVTAAETPFVLACFKHDDLRLYASMGQSNNEIRILARRDHGIEQAKDLRGKSIGAQKGSAIHFFLTSFLLFHHINPNHADLRFMRIEELSTSLVQGKIDAISIREPFLSQAKEALGAGKYIEFSVEGLYTKTYNLVGYKNFVSKYPGAMEKILSALNKAADYADQHPQKALKIVAKRLVITLEDAAILWEDLRLRVSLNQGLVSIIEEQALWAVEAGIVKKNDLLNGKMPDLLKHIDAQPLSTAVPHAVSLVGLKLK